MELSPVQSPTLHFALITLTCDQNSQLFAIAELVSRSRSERIAGARQILMGLKQSWIDGIVIWTRLEIGTAFVSLWHRCADLLSRVNA